jgi:hypothetical protein
MSVKALVILASLVTALAAAVFCMHGPGSHERMHALGAMIHGRR